MIHNCLDELLCRRTQGNVVALQLPIESGATDAEHLSSERLIASRLFEDALDGNALEIGKGSG